MGLHRRAKFKLRKQLSNRESVQDNHSINLMNAMTALDKLHSKPLKRIRSMEIETNSFSESSKNAERSNSVNDDSNSDSGNRPELKAKRTTDRPRTKNNTLPN